MRFAPALGTVILAVCAAGMMTAAHGEPSRTAHGAALPRPVAAATATTPGAQMQVAPVAPAAPAAPVWEAP